MCKFPDWTPSPPLSPASGTLIVSPESSPMLQKTRKSSVNYYAITMQTLLLHVQSIVNVRQSLTNNSFRQQAVHAKRRETAPQTIRQPNPSNRVKRATKATNGYSM